MADIDTMQQLGAKIDKRSEELVGTAGPTEMFAMTVVIADLLDRIGQLEHQLQTV